MHPSIAVVTILLAMVSAMPSNLYPRDKVGLCTNVGGLCLGSSSDCCLDKSGVAACKDGTVEFESCASKLCKVNIGSDNIGQAFCIN